MPMRVAAIFAVPIAIVAVLFLIVGYLIWWPLALVALPAAGLVGWWYWYRADERVLGNLDARPLGEKEGARFHNVVESLCLTSGIDEPDLMVIDNDTPNLASVSGRTSTLVATTGLIERLDAMEMEGVVAHGLAKLEEGSPQYPTLVAAAGPLILGPQRSLARTWSGGDVGVIRFDISGVGLTRYPPGLRTALQRISESTNDLGTGDGLGTCWLIPPMADRIPLEHRIEVLGEL